MITFYLGNKVMIALLKYKSEINVHNTEDAFVQVHLYILGTYCYYLFLQISYKLQILFPEPCTKFHSFKVV